MAKVFFPLLSPIEIPLKATNCIEVSDISSAVEIALFYRIMKEMLNYIVSE